MKFFKDILTEKDNDSFDLTRLCVFVSFIVYNMVTLRHAIHDCNDFDPINYATGLSILIGVISAGMTLKYTKE